jgi:histidyl-tRNA synthetase
VGGGGRYDRLIEAFGGEATPAVGCAAGIDRVAIALQTQNAQLNAKTKKPSPLSQSPITSRLRR